MMRAHLPLLALSLLLPACAMERSASLTAPPVGAKTVRLCATVDDQMRDFTGWIDPGTGDTLVAGRRFRDEFPAGYAEGQPWYGSSGHTLPYLDLAFWPYGKPRTLESGDLREPGLKRIDRLDGVDVFITPAEEARPASAGKEGLWQYELVYVLVHPGCVFQPYMSVLDTGDVVDGG